MAEYLSEFREPLNPRIFFEKILIFIILLALVQYIHLMYLSISGLDVLITWSIFYTAVSIILYIYYFVLFNQNLKIFRISYKLLIFILVISFFAKLVSRYDYIESVLSVGLYYTRTNPAIGSGGWSTYLSVWFYPASILLLMIKIPVKLFRITLLLTAIIIILDLMFVGTRGGPFLVILFIIFTSRKSIKIKYLIYAFLFIILFTLIFSYTTEYRTQSSITDSFSWLVLFQNTISTEIVEIKPIVLEFCNEEAPFLFPFLFLSHYVSHSIGELTYLVSTLDTLNTGGGNTFIREICAAGFCDQSVYTERMENINTRGGVYGTILAPLIYDSSLPMAIFIILSIVLINIISIIKSKIIGPSTIVILVVLSVAPVANYIYTGLGLIQFILVIGLYHGYKIFYSFFYTILKNNQYRKISLGD